MVMLESFKMIKFLRTSFKSLLAIALVLALGACSTGGTSGLEPFKSQDGRYGFLFPTGWTRVAVDNGPEVVYHDLINSDETLSLVISKLENEVDLDDLGGATAVGERLFGEKDIKNPIQLLGAEEREVDNHKFYDLEYAVNLEDKSRHEFATVVVDRGYLYTLAASSSEQRWSKMQDIYKRVVSSFTFFV
jgi:photosystem II oxygen-evolving enhancer protein 2